VWEEEEEEAEGGADALQVEGGRGSRGCTCIGSSMPQGLRGSIPGGVEMRAKGDDGGLGRGGRGTISSVLGGVLSLLVELRERMVGIALSFAAKASDVNALGRTWRRGLQ